MSVKCILISCNFHLVQFYCSNLFQILYSYLVQLFCSRLVQLFCLQLNSYFTNFSREVHENFNDNIPPSHFVSSVVLYYHYWRQCLQHFWNVMCSIMEKLHSPSKHYQYKFASTGLLNIIPLYQNWMNPTFPLFAWWLFPVLHTRIQRLKWKIVYRIHIYET